MLLILEINGSWWYVVQVVEIMCILSWKDINGSSDLRETPVSHVEYIYTVI